MKKILFIDTGLEYGGGTKSFLYLLGALSSKNEYKIYVYFENDYMVGDKKISSIIESYGAKFIYFEHKKRICKFKKELLRLFSKKLLDKVLYKNDLDFAIKLFNNIGTNINSSYELNKKIDINLVHLNNHFSTNLAYNEAANLLGIKVIQHLRKNSKIEDFKLSKLKKLSFLAISVSNSTYDFYANQMEISKNIVYNPVIYSGLATNQHLDNSDISIIMPANFLSLKGHSLVFDAFLGLKRDDVKLYLAGGEVDKKLIKKLQILEEQGKVKYLGFIKNMDEIYAKSDYILGFSSDEGLPRVVIEGLSAGLGVIYSDIPVIKEIYNISSNKDNFHIVKRDSASLLECLKKLKKPSSKEPDMAIISNFSLENYLCKIEKIYKDYL
ncbi:glycoside hydrolase [Campylobacter fetus subsp. testudinum]|uniref:glycosyltransferase family 4 protein n=1 Tax=Campylobacter fetus TaxID=196 RepID=UPI000818A7C0|nr:glycosyltransferase family 4 protein [Campylobacter fetus]AVK81629.1 glycoside hydrolase [Campylobacter fetus subsp. testudinum]MPB71706.1 glycosyltransferase family 4 protein [Campylobacter fetus]MPB77864.1 glycosyltransferase family 4 protein [Campylobacter fetus]OCR86734.1 glycoside hydrolase [Campylobacter fetus subsp. testudinum]OCS03774.1 glycoside hydrolase [Campylobacter fetus subsp. testudinum]